MRRSFLIVTFIVRILQSCNMICWAASAQGVFCCRILCMQRCLLSCTPHKLPWLFHYPFYDKSPIHVIFNARFYVILTWLNRGHSSAFNADLSFSPEIILNQLLLNSQLAIELKEIAILSISIFTCTFVSIFLICW